MQNRIDSQDYEFKACENYLDKVGPVAESENQYLSKICPRNFYRYAP